MTKGHWAAVSLATILVATGCKETTTIGLMPCTTTDKCSATQFCSGGACYPKLAVGSCGANSEHAANEVCTSGVCLGGACCSSACATADPICGATSCDFATGACQYPTAAATCGPAESCAGGSHTAASSCDGQGVCALAHPEQCPSMACFDSARCVAVCHDNSGCGASEYCAYGQCTPKAAAGTVCGPTSTSAAGSDCSSGSCLGTRCCSSPCNTTDSQCGATACDSSGSCVYPEGTRTCGALQSCTGATYTPQSTCDGNGSCAASAPQTCEPYVCDQPGAICRTSCTLGGTECAADGYCKAAHCTLKGHPGQPCAATSTGDSNQACLSSICSVNCCLLDCQVNPTTQNGCKGTCDSTGACAGQICPNHFGCSGTATCNTRCSTSADCDSVTFCDTVGAACCTLLGKGDTIYIDGVSGDDANPCCGAQASPCQTVTHAMELIASSKASGVFLWVLNSDGTRSWTAKERYPIHLGWGVTLHAPSIHFVSQADRPTDLFDVYAYDSTDSATVKVEGGVKGITTDGVYIGYDPDLLSTHPVAAIANSIVAVNDAVTGETALPLVLAGAWINSRADTDDTYALTVGAGAAVTLGPAPIEIGAGVAIGAKDGNLFGYHGIYCEGAGATIQDDPTATSTVLYTDTLDFEYLDVEDGCAASLTQAPILGAMTPTQDGWDGTLGTCNGFDQGVECDLTCDSIAGHGAVVVGGSGKVTFGSASMPGSIRCAAYGFDEEVSTANGSPTVTVNGATVDLMWGFTCYNGYAPPCFGTGYSCAGAMVTEGSFSASSTTFRRSYLGVFAGLNALSIDLSGGGNSLECNNYHWGQLQGYGCGPYFFYIDNSAIVPPTNGANVVNATTSVGVNAQNVAWNSYDPTAGTQTWICSDTTYSDCTCSGANCSGFSSPGTPPDGADAIYLSTNSSANPVDSATGSQSNGNCQ